MSIPLYCFLAIPDCFFNSLSNGEYSSLLIVAVFSSKSFSGNKTSLAIKNPYLPTVSGEKAEILAVCFVKLYWVYVIAWFCFLTKSHLFISSQTFNGLSDGKVVPFFFSIKFVKVHQIFKFNVRCMIQSYLLKFSLVIYFRDEIMCCV